LNFLKQFLVLLVIRTPCTCTILNVW